SKLPVIISIHHPGNDEVKLFYEQRHTTTDLFLHCFGSYQSLIRTSSGPALYFNPRAMAGVINVSQFPFLRTISRRGSVPVGIRTSIPVTRASSSSSKTPPSSGATTAATRGEEQSAAPSFAAPAGFKTPEPKRFAIRPDKGLDVAGAALAIFFRLGTGVFLNGYSVSFVSKDEIPADQYALELAGYKVKETSKLGPRP
ncbi:unnamed protein product, partial [Linum tenue]